MFGFIRYSVADGSVIERVELSHPDALPAPDEGEAWALVPTPASDWTIALGDGEATVVPFEKPLARRLAEARRLKWEEIKAIREEKLKATPVAGVGVFDADDKGLLNIRTKIEVLDRRRQPSTTKLNWRLSTNEWAEITLKQLKDVRAAISDHRDAIMATSFAIEEQINDPSATLEQIEAIGWPD